LLASVEADELRFDQPPETEVRFFGEPGHESASGSDRTNLREKVEAGVTYRNVRVDHRTGSRLAGHSEGLRSGFGEARRGFIVTCELPSSCAFAGRSFSRMGWPTSPRA
jgi:hypothetical protein